MAVSGNPQKHRTDFKARILSISIAIIFVLFIGYAIEAFYKSPKWEDYCEDRAYYIEINNSEQCIAEGGKWEDYYGETVPRKIGINGEIPPAGYCNLYFYCQEDFNNAEEKYNRNIFFLSLGLGIITFVLAIFLLVESVSAGFMGGGVLLIIYGTIRNWGFLSDVWRTIMLGFALVVLVWVGYKKLK